MGKFMIVSGSIPKYKRLKKIYLFLFRVVKNILPKHRVFVLTPDTLKYFILNILVYFAKVRNYFENYKEKII